MNTENKELKQFIRESIVLLEEQQCNVGLEKEKLNLLDQLNEVENLYLSDVVKELKVKEKMTFEGWVISEGYTKVKDKDEYRKGMIRSDEFNLKHSYSKYLNL